MLPLSCLSAADQARLIAVTGPLTDLQVNDEGTSAAVLHVNGRWVLRSARTDPTAFDRETALLTALAAHVPEEWAARLPVPTLNGPGWHLYATLPGVPTGQRALAALAPLQQDRLLAQLAELLAAVHTAPLPTVAAQTPHAPGQWDPLVAAAESTLFPLLSPGLRQELRAALADMAADPLATDGPALIHDDLHPAHILHDPNTGTLTGLLDFGRAGRGDPAVDLAGLLYNWGLPILRRLPYPAADALLPRARRLARTYEVQWALEGLTRQDRRWFLYALGAAKDF